MGRDWGEEAGMQGSVPTVLHAHGNRSGAPSQTWSGVPDGGGHDSQPQVT